MDYWAHKKKYPGEPAWWLINGVTNANVIAAYKFKKRNSQSDALKDLTGHGNTLTNNGCSWASGSGFTVSMENRNSVTAHYLDNSTVRSNCNSIVMKIASVSRTFALPLTGGWNGNLAVWLNTPFATQSFWYDNSGSAGITHGNGMNASMREDGTLARTSVQLATTGSYGSGGTIGFTKNGEVLYLNAVASSKAVASYVHPQGGDHGEWTAFWSAGIPRLVGGNPPQYNDSASYNSAAHWIFAGSFSILAMACYNVNLSAYQHQEAYKNMLFI